MEALGRRIENCDACPRLRAHCQQIASTKRRAFAGETYWGKPVAGFGDPSARLWIVGLAPAAHGANRTGRMFTGDSSGRWLYEALHSIGLSMRKESLNRNDGLVLRDVFISAAARCAPPDNKPSRAELLACSKYLDEEFRLLRNLRVILSLGRIAHDAVLAMLGRSGIKTASMKFAHAGTLHVGELSVISSYHPSRQNTQTGRLTQTMWSEVFRLAKAELIRKSSLE